MENRAVVDEVLEEISIRSARKQVEQDLGIPLNRDFFKAVAEQFLSSNSLLLEEQKKANLPDGKTLMNFATDLSVRNPAELYRLVRQWNMEYKVEDSNAVFNLKGLPDSRWWCILEMARANK